MGAPSGQINAVVGAGSQTVAVTFDTDDGNAATNFSITSGLTTLPTAWTSSVPSLTCANVSTGNSCQLSLTYAPSQAGSGTIQLGFSYIDNAGASQSGSVSIPYASTTNDTVTGTVSPSGTVTQSAGGSTPVSITFTTNDQNVATSLAVGGLASLPAGWSSSTNTFTCQSVSTGSACQLGLTFAPSTNGSGTLMLGFTYTNNAGIDKTGSVSIPYIATSPQHLYIADLTDTYHCTINGDGTLSSCATTNSGASEPQGIAIHGNQAYVGDYANNTIMLCSIAADGSLTSCQSTGSNFVYPQAISIQGGWLYVTNGYQGTQPTYCSIGSDGTLSSCAATSGVINTVGVFVDSSYGYLTVPGNGAIFVCALNLDGSLTNCATNGPAINNITGIRIFGNFAYIADRNTNSVVVCTVGSNGVLSNCTTAATISGPPEDILVSGNQAYVADHYNHIYVCTVNSNDGTLSSCTISDGGANFNVPLQLAIH